MGQDDHSRSSPDLHRRAMAIFERVCDLPQPEQAAAIDHDCGEDAELRQEVESLLQHDAGTVPMFEAIERGHGIEAIAGDMLEDFAAPTFSGVEGRFTLIREVGRGGMGVIYEALQDSPKRRVALKVLRPGVVDDGVLRRFQRESHVLGLLQHPAIAQVYEAGSIEINGVASPFFAMEFVEGLPLDQHVRRYGLALRERLELLALVCDAIDYANEKGIVHRDLKPSNILVLPPHQAGSSSGGTLAGLVGHPKVLDFGIARILRAGVVDATTIQTEAGQLVGTLAYMSPEQVSGGSAEIDARCDVYALGVIGYLLLTGRRPLEVNDVPLPEAARLIRDEDPPAMTAHDRSLGGDLTNIIAKAMEKTPGRRYQTAGDLAADIRRYLADVPIAARPPSTLYLLGKFAKRNRGLVSGMVIAFVVLVLGVLGTTAALISSLRTNAQLDEALVDLAASNQDLERVSEFQAQQLSGISAETMGAGIREAVIAAAPEDVRADLEQDLQRVNFTDIALRTLDENIFDRSLAAIETEFAESPRVRATLLQTIASTLQELGLLEQAEAPQRAAIELGQSLHAASHPDMIASLRANASLLLERGEYDEAERQYLRVHELLADRYGPTHSETIKAKIEFAEFLHISDNFERAAEVARESIALAREWLGSDHILMIEAQALLGGILFDLRQYAEAAEILDESRAAYASRIGEHHPKTLEVLVAHAGAVGMLGRTEDAEQLLRDATESLRMTLGEDHPMTTYAFMQLASVLDSQSRFDESLEISRRVYAQRVRTLGVDHPNTINAGNSVASTLDELGRLEDAERAHRAALEASRRVRGDLHLSTLVSVGNLAANLSNQGRWEEAEPLYREMLDGMRRTEGSESAYTLQAVQNYGVFLSRMDRLAEAEPLYRESLEGRRRLFGDEHPGTLNAIYNMGHLLRRMNKLDEAEPFCVESLESYRRVFGGDHIGTLYSLGNLGELRVAQGRLDEAELLFGEQLERHRRLFGDEHPATRFSIRSLAGVLRSLGRVDEADELLEMLPGDPDAGG